MIQFYITNKFTNGGIINMNISMIIIIIYIVLLFSISIYAKKLVGSGSENFILAGRKFSTPLVAVSITGLAIGVLLLLAFQNKHSV